MMPLSHWRTIVANELYPVEAKKGGIRMEPIAPAWLSHPARRTVVRIVCDQTADPLSVVPSVARRGRHDFNIWPGLALKPSDEGSCDLFLAHLRDIICDGDPKLYEWLLMWLAAMVQAPERLPGTAAALRGVQGSGKSLVWQVMGTILGPRLHVVVDGVENLTGKFNARLENKVLVQAEEAFFAGDKRNVGKLKSMITAPTITIERKSVDSYDVANLTHLGITSNEGWVVPAEFGERRFAMFNVSSARAHDWEYFAALRRQMFDEGGCVCLLHFLQTKITVDWQKIARPVATDALRDQQIRSLDAERRWLLDLLDSGELPGDTLGEGWTLGAILYQHFAAFLKNCGSGARASDVALGKLLSELGVVKDRRTQGRKARYVFPPLSEARARFGGGLASAPEWDELKDWQANLAVVEALLA